MEAFASVFFAVRQYSALSGAVTFDCAARERRG
jgi:hypothetical protein